MDNRLARKSKQITRNFIEDIRRIGMKNNIFIFNYNNKIIKFYLPYKRDYVQQQIIFRKRFYELSLLKTISKYVPAHATILDIGSNIGNHIIYYGKILNAKMIYGFEPQEDVFEILQKNIEINKLDHRVNLFKCGLGSSNGFAKVNREGVKNNNCGANSLIQGTKGDVKILKLDNIKINDKVDLVKIDTEGFEKDVLEGGEKTFLKDMPIAWVEVDKKNEEFINNYFKELGYQKRIKLDNYGNNLFLPSKD